MVKKLSRRRLLLICCGVLVIAAAVITGVCPCAPGKNSRHPEKQRLRIYMQILQLKMGEPERSRIRRKEQPKLVKAAGTTGIRTAAVRTIRVREAVNREMARRNSGGSEAVLQEGVRGITLPYQIPGSSLVVSGIASYDGIYLEDGSDTEISGVTVLLLRNDGDTDIEYASVSVGMDGTELQFDLSDLPAGGTAVVQEKNKTLLPGRKLYRMRGDCGGGTGI